MALAWVAVVAALAAAAGAQDPLLVQTAQGAARGVEATTYLGTPFRAFRGLPYAAPPLGALRFKPPAPPAPWTGERNASAEAAPCPQMVLLTQEYAGDEDCLYLNVYAPYNISARLPVVVFYHGGAFVEGHGGARWAGPDYMLEQEVVFVAFNYRLGPLGFLSTGDGIIQGNYGLKDGVAALRWVRANIGAFGGDPGRVAVYGYSAGAAAAHLLTLSPAARGLFSAVIAGGGTATARWAIFPKPLETARQLAVFVNCTNATTASVSALAACLRAVPAQTLVETYYSFPALVGDMPMPYGPVVEPSAAADDPPFLPELPDAILARGDVAPVPLVLSDTADEALDTAYMIYRSPGVPDQIDANFTSVVKEYAPLATLSDAAVASIRAFYFGARPLREAALANFTALFTDMFFFVEGYRAAWRHAAAAAPAPAPVRFLLFSFRGRVSELVRAGLAAEPQGVMHADDLLYAIGRAYPAAPAAWPNATEAAAIRRITRLWADVAATGAPSAQALNGTTAAWPPVRGPGHDFAYLDFGSEIRDVTGPLAGERMAFWDKLVQEAGGTDGRLTTAAPAAPATPAPAPPATAAPKPRAPTAAATAAVSAATSTVLLGAALVSAIAWPSRGACSLI